MPNFTLQILPGEPIILGIAAPEWQTSSDMPAFTEQLFALMEAAAEPVFYIADMSAWHIDLKELITMANEVARSANALAHHPRLRELIVVSHMPAVDLAARGLNSDAFGHTRIHVSRSVEEALDYVRGIVREQAR